MLHTYQCWCYCWQASHSTGILVGAIGSSIHTFSAQNGRFLSTWPSLYNSTQIQQRDQDLVKKSGTLPLDDSAPDDSERPSKRQKVSLARDESSNSATEIVVARDSDNDEASIPQQLLNPLVIKLSGTSNGQHVVAVTGEDKCIRVFDLAADGTLMQLSERIMPKRPSAIALSPDDSTILCADKFGDVYSMPLIGQVYESKALNGPDADGASATSRHNQKQKPFAPSATSLTVHTKKNRDALRQQQKIKHHKAEKNALNFDHKLLLGHVSLLTDVVFITLDSPPNKPQDYILTSDRDEHIRVSRGIPQAHIIEGYCLGHTEFITKLCVPPVYSHLLISGGGDEYLLLWDWRAGRILQQLDVKSLVVTLKDDHVRAGNFFDGSEESKTPRTEVDSVSKICVTNIQGLETYKDPSGHSQVEIIVTCEGVPALFIFTLGVDAHMQFNTSVPTEGNVIDFALLPNQHSVVYSMDPFHQAFSTVVTADTRKQSSRSLVGSLNYCMESKIWKENEPLQANLVAATRQCSYSHVNVSQAGTDEGKPLTELLYSLEGLRKRTSEIETDI